MSIRREDGIVVFDCDECLNEYESGTDDFHEALKTMKEDGWRVRKDGDEWTHLCPSCLP